MTLNDNKSKYNFGQLHTKPINGRRLKSLHVLKWLKPLTLACAVVMGSELSAEAAFNFTYLPTEVISSSIPGVTSQQFSTHRSPTPAWDCPKTDPSCSLRPLV
ncbi:MAG: hypothetical protein DSM106950_16570 [Stigonema ocellatum SAG 48.90 = DSM 106950]|nr:hypothetical protein [Stigonema ocellatum SAG 48.90 = DSM 106950]